MGIRVRILSLVLVIIAIAGSSYLWKGHQIANEGRTVSVVLPPPPPGISTFTVLPPEVLSIEELQRRAERDPGFLNLNDLAQAYYSMGRKTGREEYFENAKATVAKSLADLSRDNKGARLLEIRLLQASHQFAESVAKIDAFEKDFPGTESTASLKVTSFVALGKADKAREVTNRLLESVPTSAAFVLAGLVAEESGDSSLAVEYLTKAIEREEPADAATLAFPRALLGRLYLRRGRFDESRKCLETALKIDPNDVMSLRLMAHLETFEGHLKEAEQLLVRAIDVYSDADILVQLSRVKRLMGEDKQSEDMLRAAEEKFRSDLARSHYGHRLQMAQLLLERHDPAAAKEAAELASADRESRGHPFVEIVFAKAKLEEGDAKEAKSILETPLSSGYEHPAMHHLAGEIELALGDREASKREFVKAFGLNAKYVEGCQYCPLF